jgi:Zn-dependent protease with chaperone function
MNPHQILNRVPIRVDLGGHSAVALTGPCIGPEILLTEEDLLCGEEDLLAVLAHERGHHALGHTTAPPWRRYVWAIAALALWLNAHTPTWGFILLVAAGGGWLAGLHRDRREEYDADAWSVLHLDAQGHRGLALVTQALTGLPPEPRWITRGGWVLSGHPTTWHRRARLAVNVRAMKGSVEGRPT